jgi:DNA-binding SARP family transcriptional activator
LSAPWPRPSGSNGVEQLAALEEAVGCYTGELLPELYEEWALKAREALSQRFRTALQQLIGLYEERGEIGAALDHAQCLLHHDSLHEAPSGC